MRAIDADFVHKMIDKAEELFEKKPDEENRGRKYFDCKALRYFIDKFPTLDVVPVRHSKWENLVEKEPDMYGWVSLDTVFCSLCHSTENKKSLYCPNCGALMDLEEQNEGGC